MSTRENADTMQAPPASMPKRHADDVDHSMYFQFEDEDYLDDDFYEDEDELFDEEDDAYLEEDEYFDDDFYSDDLEDY